MANVKEKKQILFNLLSEYYHNKGFKLDLKKSTFSDTYRQVYWHPYNKSSNRIIYQPRLTLRFPTVQKIQDEIFPNTSNFTVNRVAGRELSKELGLGENFVFNDKFLIENRSYLYVINNDDNTDPQEIFADHKQYMDKIGLKLFEGLNTLQDIDQFINEVILSKPIQSFSQDEINSTKKKSLNQEIVAGLITANLIDKQRGKKLMEACRIVYQENTTLIEDLEQTMQNFN